MKTPAKWILGLLLGAYLAGRVWILNISTTIEWWDTHSYAHRDNPAFNLGHLVSFTGRAPRLWGAPLFFHFFHTDQYRAEAQWAVSTFAWALLAWAVWRLLRTLLARVVACVAILGYALMTAVTEWDFTVLSESLSISLGLIVVAFFLLWARNGAPIALAGMVAAGFYWTFVRPELRLFVVVLILVLAWYAWRIRERRRSLAAAVAVLGIAVGWCSAILPVTDRHYPKWSATQLSTLSEEQLVWKLLWIYQTPAAEHAYEDKLGMPKCPEARAVALGQYPDVPATVLDIRHRYVKCPELRAWALAHGTEPLAFALAAPDLVAKQEWNVMPAAIGGFDTQGMYGGVKPVLPAWLDGWVFSPTWTGVWTVLVLVLVAILAALAPPVRRRHRLLVGSALVLVGTGLVSEVVGLAVAAFEVSRYSVQENLAVRIAIVILLAVTLDVLAERAARALRGRRAGVGGTPAGDTGQEDAGPASVAAEDVGAGRAAW